MKQRDLDNGSKRSYRNSQKKYVNFLKLNNFNVQKAYLFGSYAAGKYHEDSDIDLVIIMRNLSNSFITQVELMKISCQFDKRIKPHPIEESDFNLVNPFAHEILNKGIQIA